MAADARLSDDFLIVARTDARTSLGLDEALRRAERFAKAGADILFVESPETEEEMARIGSAFDVPVLINVVEGGRTPLLPAARLEALGFSLAIFPAAGFLTAAQALHTVYAHLRATCSSLGSSASKYDFMAFSKLMGFERYLGVRSEVRRGLTMARATSRLFRSAAGASQGRRCCVL